MSSFTLVRRAALHADSSVGGGVSPLDVGIAAVKTASAFVVPVIRDRRQNVSRQRVTLSITNGDAGPTKDFAALGTAVDMASSVITTQLREKRTDGYQGATVDFFSSTVLRATFHQPAAGDTIDIDAQVIEHKARRGATVRLLNATTLRMEWDGTLAAGESIDAMVDCYDMDDLGDELLELDFKLLRLLGFSGENSMEDGLTYDQAGNPITVRIRTFNSKANRLLATAGIPDGDPLEAGEISRVLATLTWSTGKNRPTLIVTDLLAVAATPGVS